MERLSIRRSNIMLEFMMASLPPPPPLTVPPLSITLNNLGIMGPFGQGSALPMQETVSLPSTMNAGKWEVAMHARWLHNLQVSLCSRPEPTMIVG